MGCQFVVIEKVPEDFVMSDMAGHQITGIPQCKKGGCCIAYASQDLCPSNPENCIKETLKEFEEMKRRKTGQRAFKAA